MFIEATFTDRVRVENIRRMCHNGRYLGHVPGQPQAQYYCVDGKVWLTNPDRAVRLGDYWIWADEVRRGLRAMTLPEEVPA